MSLKPQVIYLVPEATARVARAIFPKGHPYLRMYDTLGTIFQDRDFSALFPQMGNLRKRRCVWRSRRSSSSRKACPIVKLPTRSAAASTGSVRHDVALVECWLFRAFGDPRSGRVRTSKNDVHLFFFP